MKDDLISRSALRKAVNDFYDSSFEGIVSSDLIKYAQAVDDYIDNAPTVDSLDLDVHIGGRCCGKRQRLLDELRPKGKWELYQYQESRKKDWYCTACATIVKKPLEKKYIFCPYCGADMRGEA